MFLITKRRAEVEFSSGRTYMRMSGLVWIFKARIAAQDAITVPKAANMLMKIERQSIPRTFLFTSVHSNHQMNRYNRSCWNRAVAEQTVRSEVAAPRIRSPPKPARARGNHRPAKSPPPRRRATPTGCRNPAPGLRQAIPNPSARSGPHGTTAAHKVGQDPTCRRLGDPKPGLNLRSGSDAICERAIERHSHHI